MATPRRPIETMQAIADQFAIGGEVVDARPYGSGHINETHLVAMAEKSAQERRYIFQRINDSIFKNVPALMDNICRVTTHIRGKLEQTPGHAPDRETLTVVPTRDDHAFLKTESGQFWRAYLFIEDALTYDVPRSNRQILEAARAFGRFQAQLADLPAPALNETIPYFHDTPRRFKALREAVEQDNAGRAAACGPEIEFALGQEGIAATVTSGLEAGRVPVRVTHNDTKINNVMLDNRTGVGVCVIDLDTVMPGSLLYDFGDQVRSTVGNFQENERALGRVYAQMDRFEALAAGYADTAGEAMTPAEIDLLPLAGTLMTYEVGIRFLADFLLGDIYFRTAHAEENLDRARTQFALVRSLQEHEQEMRTIVARAFSV